MANKGEEIPEEEEILTREEAEEEVKPVTKKAVKLTQSKGDSSKLVAVNITTIKLQALSLDKVEESISKGTVVARYSKTNFSPDVILRHMPEEVKAMGSKGRGQILGVDAVMVYKSFLVTLIASRLEGNPTPLVYAGVLAVAISYTISREWVAEYKALPSPHVFSRFEVTGRKAVTKAIDGKKVDWVEGSNMNASALRLFGSMLVEAGSESPFLKELKMSAGTLLNPPKSGKERDLLMIEGSKSLSDADKEAFKDFASKFTKYATVVGNVFGAGTLNVVSYVEAANLLGEVYI